MYWKSALSIPYSPLMDCYFYTSANGEWQVAVYTLLFFFIVSINGKRLSKYIFYSSFSLLTFAAKKIISYDAAT